MQFLLPHSVSVADNRKKVYLDLLQMLGLGTKSPRTLTKNFPNSYGDILSDIMFIVYVCEGTDFPYTFHLVQFTVSPVTNKFGVIGFTLTILNILKHAKPHHVILFNTSQV